MTSSLKNSRHVWTQGSNGTGGRAVHVNWCCARLCERSCAMALWAAEYYSRGHCLDRRCDSSQIESCTLSGCPLAQLCLSQAGIEQPHEVSAQMTVIHDCDTGAVLEHEVHLER